MYNYYENIKYLYKMNKTSYIYIIKNRNEQKNVYKIGKTTNKEKTVKNFTSKYPIRKAFRPVDRSLSDYVLNMVLTILGPYRTFLKDGRNLDNAVEIEKNVLLAIIEQIIARANDHKYEVRLNYIPKNIASSINCRKKIPKIYWHQFCENINRIFPNQMPIPMDIDDEPKILFNDSNFDHFIFNYHDSLNILIVKNEDKLKRDNLPKSSIKHYFQPSVSQSQQSVYQNSLIKYQNSISTPITSNFNNGFTNQSIGNLFNTNRQTAATSLAWNSPSICQPAMKQSIPQIPQQTIQNHNNSNNIFNNWNQQLKII
jgi:hypothetical protein